MGIFFLIAPFPDLCLLVPFYLHVTKSPVYLRMCQGTHCTENCQHTLYPERVIYFNDSYRCTCAEIYLVIDQNLYSGGTLNSLQMFNNWYRGITSEGYSYFYFFQVTMIISSVFDGLSFLILISFKHFGMSLIPWPYDKLEGIVTQ